MKKNQFLAQIILSKKGDYWFMEIPELRVQGLVQF